MNRRELLIRGGTTMAWPFAARAQQKAMPVIGFLSRASPGQATVFLAALREGLGETGYVEGQNFAMADRWAEGSNDRLPALATDLVRLNVDVIVTDGTPPSRAAKRATSTIPIVFLGGDPVGDGLVAGLARPGGNLTGVSVMATELLPKRLELLSEMAPKAKVIALLVNPKNPSAERVIGDMQAASRARGVQLYVLKAGTTSEIDVAFSSLGAQLWSRRGKVQANHTRGHAVIDFRQVLAHTCL